MLIVALGKDEADGRRLRPGLPANSRLWSSFLVKLARVDADQRPPRPSQRPQTLVPHAGPGSPRTLMSNAHSVMHFTHIDNLPGILAAGCLRADNLVDHTSALKVEAADLDIKARRKRMRIDIAPYGCVADYVPFYFAPRSPMLYRIANGGVAGYTEGQDPLVYLVSSAESAAADGASFVFSDGNCASSMTRFTSDGASAPSRSRPWGAAMAGSTGVKCAR